MTLSFEEGVSAKVLGSSLSNYYCNSQGKEFRKYLDLIADSIRKCSDDELFWGFNNIRNVKCKLDNVIYKKHIRFENFPQESLKNINFEPINQVVSIVLTNLLDYVYAYEDTKLREEEMCEAIVIRWALVCSRMHIINW
jgi:hypothetical protein